MNNKQSIINKLNYDKIIFQKNGNIKVKEFYFYTHGRTESKLADSITSQLINENTKIKIIDKSNHFNPWPKDSWFEVIFKII